MEITSTVTKAGIGMAVGFIAMYYFLKEIGPDPFQLHCIVHNEETTHAVPSACHLLSILNGVLMTGGALFSGLLFAVGVQQPRNENVNAELYGFHH